MVDPVSEECLRSGCAEIVKPVKIGEFFQGTLFFFLFFLPFRLKIFLQPTIELHFTSFYSVHTFNFLYEASKLIIKEDHFLISI
jgi:hypothetical protein